MIIFNVASFGQITFQKSFGRYNATSICDTIFSFPSIDIYPAGITFDGNFIWCINTDNPYIYKYTLSGLLIDSILNPAGPLTNGDIDFDGSNLLFMSEEADTLYKINPVSGAVISRVKVVPCTMDCYGVAFDGTYIWISNYNPYYLYKLDASTGAVLNTFPISPPTSIVPIKFINNKLYGISEWPGMLHEIDTSNGNILSTVPWCLVYPLGFCEANNHFWGVSSGIFAGGTQRIYQFDSLLATNILFNSSENNSFEIFPNPSTGNFTISFSDYINKGVMEVFNVFGEKILQEWLFNESKKEISLKNISQGIYFVEVSDGVKRYCQKLIIEHN